MKSPDLQASVFAPTTGKEEVLPLKNPEVAHIPDNALTLNPELGRSRKH